MIDRLRELLRAARVSADRPLELYCAHGVGWEEIVLEHHTAFGGHIEEEGANCRITTGPEFDEHAMAEYVFAAANSVAELLDAHDRMAGALAESVDRFEAIFRTVHPGEMTDDEMHGIAQSSYFGAEHAAAAIPEEEPR